MEKSGPHQALDDALLAALTDGEGGVRGNLPAAGASGLAASPEPAGGDASRRAAALDALARGGSRNLSSLLGALRSPDQEVVIVAAGVLGEMRDPAAVPHLIRLLSHTDLNVAQAAIDALGKLRAPSAAASIEAMLESDPWLRFAAVHALGEIGHPGSVHALMHVLEDPALSEVAIEALGKIATVPAVTVLAEIVFSRATTEGFEGSLLALGTALARVGDRTGLDNSLPWQRLASDEASEVHSRLAALLVARDVEPDGAIDRHFLKEAAITVIRGLGIAELYPALVEAAWDLAIGGPLLDALVFAGLEGNPAILDGLGHHDADVRVFCCTAVAAMGIDEAAPACEALLESSEARVRVAALRALAALDAEKALPSMIRCLADPSEPVSGTAVRALGAMDPTLVTGALLGAKELATTHAALVLEVMRIAPCSAQQRFVQESIQDERAEVRRAAVAVLAANPCAEVTDVLEPLLRDPSVEVRVEAIHALGQRRLRKSLSLLLETFEHDRATRDASLRAIGRIGDGQTARRLIAGYHEHDHGTRLRIIDALGTIAAPSAEPFLADLHFAPHAEVRIHAVAAIGRYATDGAVSRLVRATGDADPGVRLAALESLSALSGRPSAVEAFERLCLDPVPAISTLARRNLGKS